MQPCDIPALYRSARGHGRPVADQPSAQAHQDRCPRRAPRPHHPLPVGRGRRHWPHDPCHPRCDPPPSSAADICMTLKLSRSERNRQGRSVRRAEKRPRKAARRIMSAGLSRKEAFRCTRASVGDENGGPTRQDRLRSSQPGRHLGNMGLLR